MNLINLAVGDLAGTAINAVAKEFIKKVAPDFNSKFLDLFNQSSVNENLSLEDFDLNMQEEQELINIRDMALDRGLENIEVEVQGQRYKLQTKDFSFIPLV